MKLKPRTGLLEVDYDTHCYYFLVSESGIHKSDIIETVGGTPRERNELTEIMKGMDALVKVNGEIPKGFKRGVHFRWVDNFYQ